VWSTAANHESISLTVVGPDGTVYQKQFASGTTPSFRLQDLGAKVSDGSYRYEMRFSPTISAGTKRQLAAARAANDDVAAARIQREAGLTEEMVQSGSLAVMNGAFVTPDATEPAAPAHQPVAASTGGTTSASSISSPRTITPLDVVTPDDAIIQGSLCVGLDCVNNESFGFDTIRLKENSTRIKFEDTSVGSFPSNDWQLTANDSASGGANKFSIEDITGAKVPFTVTGGAATNSIFVDSTGRVGFRTSTPVLDLHVNTSNTPALRLEQNNSGGFTAQTWDVAGNEANFFVRDVTGGSRLPFRIRPGAPTSSIDIAADGDVGIGTASPAAKLNVSVGNVEGIMVSSTNSGFLELGKTGATRWRWSNEFDATNIIELLVGTSGATPTTPTITVTSAGRLGIGTISPGSQLVVANGGTTSSVNAGATQFTVASSRTFKENIEPTDVPDILQKIDAVPVVTYDFKDNGPKNRLGLIAEDFHQVLGRGDDKHIDGQDVQMALWMAVQKLSAENKALTERLAKIEGSLAQKP
jgi:hypothetical protein